MTNEEVMWAIVRWFKDKEIEMDQACHCMAMLILGADALQQKEEKENEL
jgi:hypothetical protein